MNLAQSNHQGLKGVHPMLPRALIIAGVVGMTLGASDAHAQDNPVVIMETSLGNITIELFQDKAPVSVENFLAYANDDFYKRHGLSPRDPGVHDPGRWDDG